MTLKEMNEKILSNPKRRKEVAYHEAAHFVTLVAYSQKCREYPYIERVSIAAEEGPNLGYVRHRPFVFPGMEKYSPTEKLSYAIRQSFAGPAAGFILFDEYEIGAWEFFEMFWGEGQGDLEQAQRFYMGIDGEAQFDDFEPSEPLFRLFEESVKDVQKYWPLIEEMGERLLQTPVIEGEELESLTESLLDKATGG